MKIILVGASGTLGQAIYAALSPGHEIIRAGRQGADVRLDMRNLASVQSMYREVGSFDAVVCAAGGVHFGPLESMTPEEFGVGLGDKLMGQVNLVAAGQNFINDRGSFTLVSGILNSEPIRLGASASMVNGAVDSFVLAASIELSRGVRINSVNPTLLHESVRSYGAYFNGFKPVSADDAALAFVKSVEGAQTGKVYRVW